MYENQTYETILDRTLSRVATDIDKREGSIIMNSVAPVSAEHANIYIQLDGIIQDGYADTATRPYLIQRCKERGIIPHEATKAVLKGKFNMEIPIGSRFSLNDLNYIAKEFIEVSEDFYYYQMECEQVGTDGNKHFGEITPIEFINSDFEGFLVELLIPAEDEEDTEKLRARYFSSLKSSAFGGNKQDYIEKTHNIEGVSIGGVVPVPVWNGGGTVKLLIIDGEYNKASTLLISTVQNAVDPNIDGTGTGFAPIGHTVTVDTAKEVEIFISTSMVFTEGQSWDSVKAEAEQVIKDYLLSMRKVWENGNLVVRLSQVETRLLNLDAVLDISDTKIGRAVTQLSDENIIIASDELPVFGGITNG